MAKLLTMCVAFLFIAASADSALSKKADNPDYGYSKSGKKLRHLNDRKKKNSNSKEIDQNNDEKNKDGKN